MGGKWGKMEKRICNSKIFSSYLSKGESRARIFWEKKGEMGEKWGEPPKSSKNWGKLG